MDKDNSQTAVAIVDALASYIYDVVENKSFNGEATGPFGNVETALQEDGFVEALVFAGDRVASEMTILPPEVRKNLAAFADRDYADMWREFARGWNKEHPNLQILEGDGKIKALVDEAYMKLPPAIDATGSETDADLSAEFEDKLTEFESSWHDGYEVMFRISMDGDVDDGLALNLYYNDNGEAFPGTSDRKFYHQGFSAEEIKEIEDGMAKDRLFLNKFADGLWDKITIAVNDEKQAAAMSFS